MIAKSSVLNLTFDRRRKNEDRILNALDLSPRRSAILLPSHEGKDTRLLHERGVFTANTKEWWIERNWRVVGRLQTLRNDLSQVQGYPIKAEIVHNTLEEFAPPEPVDYVNADVMSSFTLPLGMWFETKLRTKLIGGATIVLNIVQIPRRNDFYEWFLQRIEQDMPEEVAYFRVRMRLLEAELLAPCLLLCCSLHDKHFDWYRVRSYRDRKVNMTSIRVDNVHPRSCPVWPSLVSLNPPAEYGGTHVSVHCPKGESEEIRPTAIRPDDQTQKDEFIFLQRLKDIQARLSDTYGALAIVRSKRDARWQVIARQSGKVVQTFVDLDTLEATFF